MVGIKGLIAALIKHALMSLALPVTHRLICIRGNMRDWHYPLMSRLTIIFIQAVFVERPKVIYNELNDEYLLWFHADDAQYYYAGVGVARSKHPQDLFMMSDLCSPIALTAGI